MRILLIILAASAVSSFQDDPKIAELILQLDADDFQTREQAQDKLLELGEKAVPALEQAAADGKGELKIRAEATILAIRMRVKSRSVYRDPNLVTIDVKDEDLADVLHAIGRQVGVRIDRTALDATKKVTLAAEKEPLFKILDRLCRTGGDRSYAFNEEGQIEFSRDPHVPYPTAYAGPTRVRIRKMELIRTQDFKDRSAVLQLSLDSDYERYLNPLAGAEIEILEAKDDRGRKLPASEGFEGPTANGVFVQGGGRIVIRGGVFGGVQPERLEEFSLKGLDRTAARFTIRGKVRLTFPLNRRTVVMPAPQTTGSTEVDGYRITVQRGSRRRPFSFTFKAPPGGELTDVKDIHGRLTLDSLVAIDAKGKEHKGAFNPATAGMSTFVMGPGFRGSNDPGVTLQTTLTGVNLADVKELRFQFVDKTFTKRIPFELADVELP